MAKRGRKKKTEEEIREQRKKLAASGEPTWDHWFLDPVEFDIALANALTWYSEHATNEKKKRWLLAYLREIDFPSDKLGILTSITERHYNNVAAVLARCKSRKADLQAKHLQKIIDFAEDLLKNHKSEPVSSIWDITPKKRKKTKEVDPIVLQLFDKLDKSIEEFIVNGWPPTIKFLEECNKIQASRAQANETIDKFQSLYDELSEALNGDEDLKEAYSHITVENKQELIHFIDGLRVDVDKIKKIGVVKKRKQRKLKEKSDEDDAKKVQFLEKHTIPKTNLTVMSVDPKTIIGSKELWVYNVKYRRLGVYHAKTSSGLSVKGTTIQNCDEENAWNKKLRNPHLLLPDFMRTQKGDLKSFFDSIPQALTLQRTRLNRDTVLLRAIK